MTDQPAALYRLVAQALTYPDRQFVANLTTTVGQLQLELLDDQHLPLAALIQELSRLAMLPLDQVQGEHTRLFINAYPHVPCPPYESAYVEGELLGAAAEQVAALYREWGLEADGEAVDQAGTELEFLAFLLTLNTPDAMRAADDLMTEHVLHWLPRFAQDVARESRLGFYRSLGELLQVILDEQRVPGPSSATNS